MKITYFGHACMMVEVKGKNLLFDPFITPNELASHIKVAEIKPDYILISHGHEDHVADVATIARQSGAKLVSNFEIITWFGKQGLTNGHPMNHGGQWHFDFGTVKMVNAIHSSTLPDGSGGGNPAGFVIMSDEGDFYFAGDTALTMDMQLIPKFSDLKFSLLPVGDNFTMGIEEAVMAAKFLDCKQVVAMHYDTFGFIKIDHDKLRKAFADAGVQLHMPEIGQSIDL